MPKEEKVQEKEPEATQLHLHHSQHAGKEWLGQELPKIHLQQPVVTTTTPREMYIQLTPERKIKQSGVVATTTKVRRQELKAIKNPKKSTYFEADLAVKQVNKKI